MDSFIRRFDLLPENGRHGYASSANVRAKEYASAEDGSRSGASYLSPEGNQLEKAEFLFSVRPYLANENLLCPIKLKITVMGISSAPARYVSNPKISTKIGSRSKLRVNDAAYTAKNLKYSRRWFPRVRKTISL